MVPAFTRHDLLLGFRLLGADLSLKLAECGLRVIWDPDTVLVANDRNVGFGRANNQAIARAKGDLLWLLNPDTRLQPGALERGAAFMAGHPSIGMAGTALVNPDGTPGPRNGVSCGAIEHKMGIKASATCSLVFNDATGYLLGEENRGLAGMDEALAFELFNTVGVAAPLLSPFQLRVIDAAAETPDIGASRHGRSTR